jgi:hypothetical protein
MTQREKLGSAIFRLTTRNSPLRVATWGGSVAGLAGPAVMASIRMAIAKESGEDCMKAVYPLRRLKASGGFR